MLSRVVRTVMYPARCFYRRRNGTDTADRRKEIPNDILLGLVREMIGEGHTAVVTVKGYSMRPFLEHQRDKVKLAACGGRVRDYDAVLAEISPGHYVLHRVVKVEGDNITLMGDGNPRGTEQCTLGDIAGVVTEYIRPRRTIQASDASLQREIRLWRRLLPVRRYLLYIYKALI